MVWRDMRLKYGMPSIAPITATEMETVLAKGMMTVMSAFGGKSIGGIVLPSMSASNVGGHISEQRQNVEQFKLMQTTNAACKLEQRPADLDPNSPLIGIRYR